MYMNVGLIIVLMWW